MRIASTFLLFSVHILFVSTRYTADSKPLCIEKEKQALLDFKLSFFRDTSHTLSTWTIANDVCRDWDGVVCAADHTGCVTSLNFGPGLISYKLRPSLLQLRHLTSLDLRENHFPMRIPRFIGSLGELKYLDLSNAGFFGEIPPHLGNLSKLQYLYLDQSNGLFSHSLLWLSRLPFLQYLYLSNANLTNAIDWVSSLKMLPALYGFECRFCSLPSPPPPSISHVNSSTFLRILDLSNNRVSSLTFSCLINGTNKLQYLYLDYTKLDHFNFRGIIKSLTRRARYSLVELSLVGNNLNHLSFEGIMLPSLTLLDASSNKIRASPASILQHLPPNLLHLDLSSNLLNGTILDLHFSKFFKLHVLHLSDNNLLTLNFSEGWVPPFQLDTLKLRSCKVGPNFPSWILTQKYLITLDISFSMISGAIPDAFFNFSTALSWVNISHNKIHGILPNSSLSFSSQNLSYLDLSYNAIHGPVPLSLFTSLLLDLSNNNFSSFPPLAHQSVFEYGSIVIDISNNNLSGLLPNWLFEDTTLFVLNLENNKLSGTLLEAIGFQQGLVALHLNNNKFSGKLPSSMKRCTELTVLELANNKFSGVVPSWFGESMPQLVALTLRSNMFSGELPSSLCHLQRLQILDLSDNRLSGTVPGCVHNFSSMVINEGLTWNPWPPFSDSYFNTNQYLQNSEHASCMWKGAFVELYSRNLEERNVINLSGNLLRGEIPIGVTALKRLRSLDLSRNYLNGSIPDKIGQLTFLEVLKLSSNRLCGEIPESLAPLNFLDVLNLSNNFLSGRIPTGPQLQTFDPSSFAGNPKLCGQPLPTKCVGDADDDSRQTLPSNDAHDKDDETFDIRAFMAALGMGFAIGFLGIIGSLHFNRPWRLAFFQLVNNIVDKVIVKTCIYL